MLHNDYVELSGHQTTQTARPGVITCAEFRHRRWTVPGAYGVLPVRCGK